MQPVTTVQTLGTNGTAFLNEQFGSNNGLYLSVVTTLIATLAMFCLDVYAACERRQELEQLEEQRMRANNLATIGLSDLNELGVCDVGASNEPNRPNAGQCHNRLFAVKSIETHSANVNRKAFRKSNLLHKSFSNNSSFDSADFPISVPIWNPTLLPTNSNKMRQSNLRHSLDSLLENTALKRKFSETTSGVGFSNTTNTTGPSCTTTDTTNTTTTTTLGTGPTTLASSFGSTNPSTQSTTDRRLSTNSTSMPDLNALLFGGQLLLDLQQNERWKASQTVKKNESIVTARSPSGLTSTNALQGASRSIQNLSAISEEIGLERMIEDLHKLSEKAQSPNEMDDEALLEQQLLAQEEYVRLIEQLMHLPVEMHHEPHCPALKLAEVLVDRIVSEQSGEVKEEKRIRPTAVVN